MLYNSKSQILQYMKKIYLIPSSVPMDMGSEKMIAVSGVGGNNGIGWGGIDTDGEKDPEVKGNIFEENPFE